MIKDDTPFEARRRTLYDEIRRATLAAPDDFDGPHAQYRTEVFGSIDPGTFEKSTLPSGTDAFYEAIHDLHAEGVVEIRDGEVLLGRRPQRSDRSTDAPADHAKAGRQERESPIFAAAGEPMPCTVGIDHLPSPLKNCFNSELFPGSDVVHLYNRTIEVDRETWAITYSAILPAALAHIGDLVTGGVFAAFAKNGIRPIYRKESFLVRFPYADERELLGLSDELWRLPVIVAVGSVFADRHDGRRLCIEQYVNVMRADRYIIQSELAIHE